VTLFYIARKEEKGSAAGTKKTGTGPEARGGQLMFIFTFISE
jgi:hypothetical protein